jgi:hypothetical protein
MAKSCIVLRADLPFKQEGSLRKSIVAAGGSCYFRNSVNNKGSADELKGYTYIAEEQELCFRRMKATIRTVRS